MLWWNGTLIVATLPEQHKSMLGIFSISVTDSKLFANAKGHLWMKLIIIDVSIQSSHGYCSRHWSTERLCDSFKNVLAHNICLSRNMNHTLKYHLATEHQELEYKKQLEWASYTQPKQGYPESIFLWSLSNSQTGWIFIVTYDNALSFTKGDSSSEPCCPLCWWGIRQL